MWTVSEVVVVCGALWAVAGGMKPVKVPRCCPSGQELAPDALRVAMLSSSDATSACVASEQPRPWQPRIFKLLRGGFLPPGNLPQHWELAVGVMPECELLRVLPEHSASYALLAYNGSLMMLRGGSAPLSHKRYCADPSAALVCNEDILWVPSKCCTGDRILNGSHCVKDKDRASAALRSVHELANGSVVGVGFPVCPEGTHYAVAGMLDNARLFKDFALELRAAGGDDEKLTAGAWCADAILGEEGVRVLACESEARSARPTQATRHALYGAGLAVGAAFLAATLAAGFALPAAHHALHWRCQTHYVAALMLGDVLLAATQLAADRVPPTLCRALGEHRVLYA